MVGQQNKTNGTRSISDNVKFGKLTNQFFPKKLLI